MPYLDIPHIQKEKSHDNDACQAIAVLMAARYYGSDVAKQDFYQLCHAKGDGNLVLPWGVCKAINKLGLYSGFVSKAPDKLNDHGYAELMLKGNMNRDVAEEYVKNLIAECRNSEKVELVEWHSGDERFLLHILENEYGVIVPTLWWTNEENHSIVVTGYEIVDDEYTIHFNNPNYPRISKERDFPLKEFHKRWLDPRTDYDFIVVSDQKINISDQRKRL